MVRDFDPDQVRRRMVGFVVAAGGFTLVLVIVYYQLIGEIAPGKSRAAVVAQNAGIAAAGLAIFAIIVRSVVVRRFEPEWCRVLDGVASLEDRVGVVRQPARLGGTVMATWLAPVVLAPLDDLLASDYRAAAAELAGIALGVLGLAAGAYLLAERELRPLFAVAFEGPSLVVGRAPRVLDRFMVAWLLGSAVPLLGVVVTPVVRTGELSPTIAMTYLGIAGLAVGGALTVAAARSVTGPVDQVVEAMGRVEAGDLEVDVVVDDGGDLGRVEVGLRSMVEGLRQRRRLEDLFGRHVGVDVAREALNRGVALGGDLCDATVVFVDLIGSTSETAASPPTEVVARANRFFATVVEVVDMTGGWVNKFQGDGAMCVFGVPLPSDEHLAEAAHAAIELRRRLAEDGFDAAIGVASGPVIAGNVGTEDRFEFTVMGATVNAAARLCEAAKADQSRVLLTASTATDPRGWVDGGEILLRGFTAHMPTWKPQVPDDTPTNG